MTHLVKSFFILSTLLFCFSCNTESQIETDYDIVIYGGSSAGVIAAYSAVQKGKSVLLISPDKRLGGLSASGLGSTDIGNKYAVTGLSLDFYRRLGKYYDQLEAWTFEPRHAEEVFNDYIKEAGVEVWYEYYLDDVKKVGTEIKEISIFEWNTKEKKTVSGNQFIDATYTGDLMAKAGVSYIVGRESNELYDETYNGVQLRDRHQFPPLDNEPIYISPYKVSGDPSSGLCYGISDAELAPTGSGDSMLQAYNYRLCITQDKDNQVPFTEPDDYDPEKYELLKRLIQKRDSLGWEQKLDYFYLSIIHMPNGKTDVNNKGAFSTDFIGMNYDYPEASYERRDEIEKEHADYIKGLLYFLSTSPDITDELREEMNTWGWAKNEFMDTEHFPWKMYIREARRMIGETVMTEHHCVGKELVSDPIGLAAYTMDSHNTQRIVVEQDGKMIVKNEGNVEVGGFPPYPISYGSLTPKKSECTNLLVPVCLSASHIAYGSIRMEPVFMVMGQVSAMAASNAIDEKATVQSIDVKKLQGELENNPLLDGTRPETFFDDSDSTLWTPSKNISKVHYYHQYKSSVSEMDATDGVSFSIIPEGIEGKYDMYYYFPRNWRGTSRERVDWIEDMTVSYGDNTFQLDVREVDENWVYVGEINYAQADEKQIVISANHAGKSLPYDGVLFRPVD